MRAKLSGAISALPPATERALSPEPPGKTIAVVIDSSRHGDTGGIRSVTGVRPQLHVTSPAVGEPEIWVRSLRLTEKETG